MCGIAGTLLALLPRRPKPNGEPRLTRVGSVEPRSTSGTQTRACPSNCRHNLGLKPLQLFLAQRAIGRLECNTQEQRIVAIAQLGVMEDFTGAPVDELGNRQSR